MTPTAGSAYMLPESFHDILHQGLGGIQHCVPVCETGSHPRWDCVLLALVCTAPDLVNLFVLLWYLQRHVV